ncbi:efflux RND transporter permease subunit [Engelhardtia mirabilis]|uniref:Cobalt-zinc-cadmium resistance protein CzcA n=1 Tax=Engelhardtia mirabilis TaxID=2528011 RepID=A0A518BQA1_9BACT|nr:Cobalt-zinc-cadmium resistance protein CzcA [Planctomycetes bacterium Pla133]QDV03483.1 Cobalt-zinc-cadmium resistance protein CzcA [Planctomycetes bacterium Pla86]
MTERQERPLAPIFAWALENQLVVALLTGLVAVWGLVVAPFDWDLGELPRDRVPVDAIPDTGENQQLVVADWPGRSPRDVEDQITYPLTMTLLGVSGVESVRSSSMMGLSSIAVIFDEQTDFQLSRTRVLEQLASLDQATLPPGVRPRLGPDATAMGQVFWYTLEGWSVATEGAPSRPAGGFGLEELRSIQDWVVRPALAGVEGVAEVASIGGYVREYQIEVDPDAMRAAGVTLQQVAASVRASNVDVGARTVELNRAEYVVRGLGLVESVADLEAVVVKSTDSVPVTLREVARVSIGPALRRGALDKGGTEAVGGVVVVRYGANPMAVLERVKARIAELAPSLPRSALADGTQTQVRIVPFYDRTELIGETLGTLERALRQQMLVTVAVIVLLLARLRAAVLVAALVPLAVLVGFVGMRLFGVDANVVALSGIAIAIGTLVDVGIVVTEAAIRQPATGRGLAHARRAVGRALAEVGGAVTTAVLTTVIGFLPVFAMHGAEGKLFGPLAATKTIVLVASIALGLVTLPAMAVVLFGVGPWPDADRRRRPLARLLGPILALGVVVLLGSDWAPLGPHRPIAGGLATLCLLGLPLLGFVLLRAGYERILRWCLANKLAFLALPAALVAFGVTAWLGFERSFGWLPSAVVQSSPARALAARMPGFEREFMPRLDEGAFLLMPVTMAHASIGEALDLLQQADRRVRAIPEIEDVVGKIGRVESALDPAPIGMVESLVTYKPEYRLDEQGRSVRQWRDEIRTPRDIWDEVAAAAMVPGLTTASMLQPIETRRIMLQTGLRAPMGVKVLGTDLDEIEEVALKIEGLLAQIEGVAPGSAFADRVLGKPYIEIDLDREALARQGLSVRSVQDVIETALGGVTLTTVIEGRERYPVSVRYPRERRASIEDIRRILVGTPAGGSVPLGELAHLRYERGPQSVRGEDGFLLANVIFDAAPGIGAVDLAERVQARLAAAVAEGRLTLPPGLSYRLAGEFENQVRASRTLRLVLPIALALIVVLLHLQLRSLLTTAMVFSGVLVAWAGGFALLWLYAQPWFLDLPLFGANLRELFQVGPVALSVAVWVGFLALFGIATDDGLLMATSLRQEFDRRETTEVAQVREAVVAAGLRRIRPCLMTSATTVLALIPVLTSTGKGSDIMVPMAIPTVGGMVAVLLSVFVVPTLYCLRVELQMALARSRA